jgi:hypothetical protein
MNYSDFQEKLEQQVKKEWTELISNYGMKNLKLFKSMQEVQWYREKFVQLDYTIEKLYQGMCFFKYYKPTQNPKYEHPFDNPGNPLGYFSNQLETRFESYLSYGLRDVISDAKKFQDYIGGMDGDDYLSQKIHYQTLYKNIFSEDLVNEVNIDLLSTDENNILEVYGEYVKCDAQKLIEEYFEDVSIHFGKLAEELFSQKSAERERYLIEYSDKLKRMINYELQVNDLNAYIKRFYFLCLCVFKGKSIDVKDNFEIFHTPELGEFDEYWWQNDPFNSESFESGNSIEDEEYGGFKSVMKNIFKNDINELLRIANNNNDLQYRYILDRLNFQSMFK